MGLISNGTTIFDNGIVNAGGSMVFISKATASSSASIEFTSGIDSTYKEYLFYFVNIHPATDFASLTFNLSTDSGSNYNVTKTSTYFYAYHGEGGGGGAITYAGGDDLAQSTNFQNLSAGCGSENDQNVGGYLHLFNPSSTTFVKHFFGRTSCAEGSDYMRDDSFAGYGNTTSAIDAVKFQMSSGNIDAGEILLFGVN